MINYSLVIKRWGEWLWLPQRYGTGTRVVLTLNVLATTVDFMGVDRKAFKTAVWEALDVGLLLFSYVI